MRTGDGLWAVNGVRATAGRGAPHAPAGLAPPALLAVWVQFGRVGLGAAAGLRPGGPRSLVARAQMP